MAIDWGAWEYAGGNGMRVGIEVTWAAVANGDTTADATIKIYTENQYNYSSDGQVLTYGGSISGTTSYTNNGSSGSVTLRATKTYSYTYGSTSYGSSPTSKTFSAALSGSYNGVTPSNSVTSAVPARPYAAPVAPSAVSVSRVSDTGSKIQWTNNATSGKPWSNVWLQKSINGGAFATVTTAIAGTATSYTDTSAVPNQKCRYQVASDNTVGTSAYVQTGDIYTTPADPVSPARTPSGSDQVITWANTGMGYTEYGSDVIAYKNGVSVGVIGSVATGIATFTHTPTNPVAAYTTTDRWKYTVRHKTTAGVQGTLYSAETAFTTETAGVTSTPSAPTLLVPDNIIIDPSLPNVFTWQHNPTDASAQTQYELQWRLAGGSTWTSTGAVVSGTSSRSMAANTFTDGTTVEWQVRTKGADASWSPWSASVTFSAALTPVLPDPVKLPVLLDLFTGKLEASNTAYEIRNYVQRFQAQFMGGGTKDVDTGYALSWSQRFICISLGRSDSTFRHGHHDIINPHGWNVTNKVLTSNYATLTITNYLGVGNRMRVGDSLIVTGVGAPFDGTWTVRDSTWNGTTGTVSFDCTAANVASAASSGAIFPVIHGKGGEPDSYPNSGKITLNAWRALYYELPFGWGGGTVPRKNGVVQVSSISLTSNVVTVNFPAPHYFAVGDRVELTGCGAPYDGVDRVVTEMGSGFIKFALTNANIASSNPTFGLIKPSGKDTFYNNFHQLTYGGDFVVPDNWVLLALRNNDSGQVEWATGESGTGWTAVTFQNSWANYGGAFQTAQYRRVGDIVELRGLVRNGTAGTSIFTLPAGFRPPATQIFAAVHDVPVTWATGAASAGTAHTHSQARPTAAAMRIDVAADGTVTHYSTQGTGYVDLSQIRFSVTP